MHAEKHLITLRSLQLGTTEDGRTTFWDFEPKLPDHAAMQSLKCCVSSKSSILVVKICETESTRHTAGCIVQIIVSFKAPTCEMGTNNGLITADLGAGHQKLSGVEWWASSNTASEKLHCGKCAWQTTIVSVISMALGSGFIQDRNLQHAGWVSSSILQYYHCSCKNKAPVH